MDPETLVLLWKIFTTVSDIIVALLVWQWKKQDEKIIGMDQTLTFLTRELAEYKLHVSETYARESHVSQMVGEIKADLKGIKNYLLKQGAKNND